MSETRERSALDLLRELEWAGTPIHGEQADGAPVSFARCHFCRRNEEGGHAPDCALDAVLRATPASDGGEVRERVVAELERTAEIWQSPHRGDDNPLSDLLREAAALLRTPRGEGEVDIEALAERVHQAYLDTCDRLGWDVRPENRVPYADLSEDSKELDRATVRAVLTALRSESPEAPSGEGPVVHIPDDAEYRDDGSVHWRVRVPVGAPSGEGEVIYPCRQCGTPRTAAEGGTTFTVCDECWDRQYGRLAARRGEGGGE